MREFSFLHCADLHLDSPFKGISHTSDYIQSVLQKSTYIAFQNLIQIAIDKEVDFVLIAGDVFNSKDRNIRAQLKFRQGLQTLSDHGIKTFVAFGNHDPLNGWSAHISWPESVIFFDGKNVRSHEFEKDGKAVACIHGISYPTAKVTTNLSKSFPINNHDQEEDDSFNIGVLHGNVGSIAGHEEYAPCTKEDLLEKKYDYWALGHIHKYSVLHDSHPTIIYSGNIQGRHCNEDGACGCTVVTVDDSGEVTHQFFETDYVRWFQREIDIEGMKNEQDLLTAITDVIEETRRDANGRGSICRIAFTGRGSLHESLLKPGFIDDIIQEFREQEEHEPDFVWLEKIKNNTQSEIDRDRLRQNEDFIGDLLRLFETYSQNQESYEELEETIQPLFQSGTRRKYVDDFNTEELQTILKQAEQICLDQLLGEEE